MKTTWGKHVKVDINDKEYTKICSFSNGCEIKIDAIEKYKELENPENLIIDTFSIGDISESIKEIYSIVKELFEIYEIYTLEELKVRIKQLIDTDERIIEHALEEICDDKKVIWNKHTNPGYLINKNDIYLFQPSRINDELVPFLYRSNKETTKSKNHNDIFSSIKVEFKDSFHCESSYNDVYEKVKTFLTVDVEEDMKKYSEIIESLRESDIKKHYIDSLTYEEKSYIIKRNIMWIYFFG